MTNILYTRTDACSNDQLKDAFPACFEQIEDIGVEITEYYEDDGNDTSRPGLQACQAEANPNDTVWIPSFDCPAESNQDLKRVIEQFVDKGVTVKFIKENLTFQNRGANDQDQRQLFHLLDCFAEFGSITTTKRRLRGIERAKAAGKYSHGKGGRNKTVDREKVRELYDQGKTMRDIAKALGCSLSSVQRCLSERQK